MKEKIAKFILIIGLLGILAVILRLLDDFVWVKDCFQSEPLFLKYAFPYFVSIFHFYAPVTALLLFPFSKINRKSLFGLLLCVITLLMIMRTLMINPAGC